MATDEIWFVVWCLGLGFGEWGVGGDSGFGRGGLEISAFDVFPVSCFDLIVVSSFDFWFRHYESSMGLGVFVALISTGVGFLSTHTHAVSCFMFLYFIFPRFCV